MLMRPKCSFVLVCLALNNPTHDQVGTYPRRVNAKALKALLREGQSTSKQSR